MRRGNLYVSPDMYMINTPGSADYIMAANFILRDKMLFGTAYPFVDFQSGVNYYKNCGIKEENLPLIMYENAAKLLHIN